MSYDKVTKAINRTHDARVIQKQSTIFLFYNKHKWLSIQKVGSFRKRKAMNCSCRICRGWDKDGKQFRYGYQLMKAGVDQMMNIQAVDVQREEEWI